jgi:hypothetical protein
VCKGDWTEDERPESNRWGKVVKIMHFREIEDLDCQQPLARRDQREAEFEGKGAT